MHSIEQLRDVFEYSETSPSGVLRKSTGKRAGSKHHSGRWNLIYDGKNYQVHRLVWALVHGSWPLNQIDHMNGDPLDNRIENLRDVDGSTNMRNRRSKGYYYHKLSGKYQVQLHVQGSWRNMGLFADEELAQLVAEEAKIKYHNNPPVYQV